MRVRMAAMIAVGALLLAAMSFASVAAQEQRPDGIAGYETESLGPGLWRVVIPGGLGDDMQEVKVGPDGSVWVLTSEGAFEVGIGLVSPIEVGAERLLAVGADGAAWLRHPDVAQQRIGTWDGETWTEVTGPRRASALEPDPVGAPGVVRDFALASDGTTWIVAGEQDSPRWERFTVERLHDDGWTTWAIGEGLPDLRCGKNCGDGSRVVAMNDGTVWVSVDQGGLLRFDGSAWEAVRPLGGAADLPIGSLVGDPGGVIWVDVLIGPDERTRARFDGAGWSVPAHAQPEVGSPTDDRPVAVAPDGTLWTAARAEDGRPILWAIDDEQRRMVSDLSPCSDAEPAATGDCAQVISVAIGPDGLVWLVVGNVDRDGLAERGVALLAVDPALALTG